MLRIVSCCIRVVNKVLYFRVQSITTTKVEEGNLRLITILQNADFSIEIKCIKNHNCCTTLLQFLHKRQNLRLGGHLEYVNIDYNT